MGSTPQADTPANVYFMDVPVASVASNAQAVVPILGPGQAIQVLSAQMIPTASQAGSATNFFVASLINLGSAGTGTTVLASRSFSATGTSIAALVPGSLTLGSVTSRASAEVLAMSYTSSGNGIAAVAHTLHLAYRYL